MVRKKNQISWKIGGEAGFGIMATGAIFAKTCMRAGLHVFDYSEYPSLIRGGHNTYQVFVSADPVAAHRAEVDMLVALNRETVDRHISELTTGAAFIYDASDRTFAGFSPRKVHRPDVHWFPLEMEQMAIRAGGSKLMRNTVALGATFALLSLDFKTVSGVVRDMFKSKGKEIVALNLGVLRAGYDAVSSEHAKNFPWDLEPMAGRERQLYVSGNDAIALGAIQAGCKFYSAYPMTPASSILHFLAEHGPKYNMVVRHAEDEIGVANEAIGAAYAGVRAMCGTAGGGFALMTEAVGLAGMTEVGVVIVEAMRGGPSTGLPTWTEQGDLRQVLHASQGDFLKIVLAPTTIAECYRMTLEAFDLAERYQTPVILMTDKYLAESRASVDWFHPPKRFDRGKLATARDLRPRPAFPRYRTDVADGIAPRTIPGLANGIFLANSDEHDEFGYSNEEAGVRTRQMDRRARKTATLLKHWPAAELIGPPQADLTIVTWGSSFGPVVEAARLLELKHRVKVNILPIKYINPLPAGPLAKMLQRSRLTVMVENNQSGQMAGWIRQHTGIELDHNILRYDGRPFDPTGLRQELERLLL